MRTMHHAPWMGIIIIIFVLVISFFFGGQPEM